MSSSLKYESLHGISPRKVQHSRKFIFHLIITFKYVFAEQYYGKNMQIGKNETTIEIYEIILSASLLEKRQYSMFRCFPFARLKVHKEKINTFSFPKSLPSLTNSNKDRNRSKITSMSCSIFH